MKHLQGNHFVQAIVMSVMMALIMICVALGVKYLLSPSGENQIPGPLIMLAFAVVFIAGSVFFEKQRGVDKMYSMVGGAIVSIVVIFILITLGNGIYYAIFANGLAEMGFETILSSIAIGMIASMVAYNYLTYKYKE